MFACFSMTFFAGKAGVLIVFLIFLIGIAFTRISFDWLVGYLGTSKLAIICWKGPSVLACFSVVGLISC
jgi:hypothetical protein